MWSWENISRHRKMTKEYKNYYKKKIVTKKIPADLSTQLEVEESHLELG